MASFIFGGDTEQTAESIARRREIAKALLEGSMYAAPQNVGEGLTAIGAAIGGRLAERRADKAEGAARSEAMSTFRDQLPFWLQSSMGGGSAPSAPSPSPSQPTRTSAPSMAPQQPPQGKEEFISMMMPAALEASERTGIDPRLIIAQAAQETGWGKSAPGNNYFGIKSHGQGGGQNLATHEYVDGKRVNVNANFRQYGGPTESALGYADFLLNNPRYQPMLNAEGLDAQLAALGQSGYATDPNYAQSVGSIARSIPLPPEMSGNQGQDAIGAVTAYQPGMVNDPAALGPARYAPGMAPQPAPTPQPPQPPFNPLMQRRDQLAQQTGSQQIAQADPNRGFLAAILAGGQGGQPSGGDFPPAPSPDGLDAMRGPQLPFDPAMLELANNPFLPEGQRAVLQSIIQQQMQAADPMRRLEMQKAQLELEQLRNPDPRDIINAGDGRLYNPNTGEWITAPGGTEDAPTVQTFFDDKGGEYKAQWNRQTGEWEQVGGSQMPDGMSLRTRPDGTVELVQGAGAGQKLTELQGKDIGFYTRGMDANAQLQELGAELTDFTQQVAGNLPMGIGNYLRDPRFRQAKVAADNFLTALLRKDTGAAITPQEFELYGPMFLPVPGDDPQTMQQKERARQVALLAIRSGLGTAEAIGEANRLALGLPEQELPTFNPNGSDAAMPDVRPDSTAATQSEEWRAGSLGNARQAIENGKDPEAVRQILEDNGFITDGIEWLD